jgi:hypothetical protein
MYDATAMLQTLLPLLFRLSYPAARHRPPPEMPARLTCTVKRPFHAIFSQLSAAAARLLSRYAELSPDGPASHATFAPPQPAD